MLLKKSFIICKSRNAVPLSPKVYVRMEMHILLTLRLMNEFNLFFFFLNIEFQDTSGRSLSQEIV